MRILQLALYLLLMVSGRGPWAIAVHAAETPPDFLLCQQATAAAERVSGVPDQLLNAISRVESGRPDPSGATRGWPWTINVRGEGHYYGAKAEAVAAAQQYIESGNRSIDIGCAQINLMYHPDAFASLEDAFDPSRNALYAARFLTDLFHQTGSWPHAAAAYHSQTPELGTDYQARVLAAWADPIGTTAGASLPRHPSPPAHPGAPAPPGPKADFAAVPTMRPHAFGPVTGASSGAPPLIRQGHGQLAGLVGRDLGSYRARPVAMLAIAAHVRHE